MKKQNKKLSFFIALLLLSLIGVLFFVYTYVRNNSFFTSNDSPTSNVAEGPKIDMNPPTEQELKETENHKTEIDSEKRTAAPPAQSLSSITPIITSADEKTTRAYISGVSEDGGLCTAIFTKDTYTFKKESKGFRDASTTVCEPILTQRSDFATNGEWTVVLHYTSTMFQGKSQERKFVVN